MLIGAANLDRPVDELVQQLGHGALPIVELICRQLFGMSLCLGCLNAHRPTHQKGDRWTDRQTDRQTDRDRTTERQTVMNQTNIVEHVEHTP